MSSICIFILSILTCLPDSGFDFHTFQQDKKKVPIQTKRVPIAKTPSTEPEPSSVLELADLILSKSKIDRQQIEEIESHPELHADLLKILTTDIKPGTQQESSRIPLLWRISLQAGKSNNPNQILRVLDAALPIQSQPLSNWQVVVIGGGVIAGLCEQDLNPKERIEEIVKTDQFLLKRWQNALQKAVQKADDSRVSNGTRYDAIQIAALDQWENCEELLKRFCAKDIDLELQQAAVRGLSYVKEEAATKYLVSQLQELSLRNQKIAVDCLTQSTAKSNLLLDQIKTKRGILKQLTSPQKKRILKRVSGDRRREAIRLFDLNLDL